MRQPAGRIRAPAARAAFAAALLWIVAPLAGAAPSTFGPVIGNALLCRSHLDNAYFYAYLASAFGPSYKHEGGAWWFKSDGASLWGAQVTDVIVSDDTSELVFVGAVTVGAPEKLDDAIRAAVGIRYRALDGSAFPVRASNPGSQIVYFNDNAKIFCAKYKPLPPAR
ncbi:MAG: hypothetical protein QFF03_18080 [Pseudomonadota bacterium]|nr:hypothetical protein [Pseudomonadota bacterium]